jgi:TPR repeat protein
MHWQSGRPWVAAAAGLLAANAFVPPVAAAPKSEPAPLARLVNGAAMKTRAQAGNATDEYDLGERYRNGDDGMPKAPAAAFCWVHRSAEHGYIMGWLSLGMMYGMGDGVAKDNVESYKWFYLVHWLTPPNWPAEVKRDAEEDMAAVARHLRPSDVDEAQRRAKAWWAVVVARGDLKPGQQYVPFPGDKPPCPAP